MRIALFCASALLLVGCAGGTPSGQASTSASSASPSDSQSSQTAAVALYWVGDTAKGLRLFREFKRVEVGQDIVTTALSELFASNPEDPDYTNLWSPAAQVNGVTISDEVATVDISPGQLNVGSEGEARAIDQIVWTVTAADPSITQVKILVDGQEKESLAGHVDLREPFARGLSYEVLADIWILNPVQGQRVSGNVVIEGVATTFEANVSWRLFQNGKVIKSGATTAGEAAPARAPWSLSLDALAAGDYVISATEYSAMDGSLVTEDTKAFTVVK